MKDLLINLAPFIQIFEYSTKICVKIFFGMDLSITYIYIYMPILKVKLTQQSSIFKILNIK